MSGAAISFVTGSGALEHNNREFVHDNVDPNRIKDNINYKEESLKDAYENCFSEAVEKYNQKQTRNDRKIKSYMKQIKESGNNEKLFYENVIQVGDKYSHGFGSGNEQQAIDILDKYARDFQERNPNLYVFNMKMHLDEASPHLHIDYIPVATGYKRGLDTRNSLTKAHQNMGISKGTGRNNNSTMKWQEREKEYLKEIAKDYKLEIIDKKTDRKHLTVDEYKIYAEQIEKQYDKYMNKSIKFKPSKIPFLNKVFLENKDYEQLANNAKYNSVTEKTVSKYTKKLEGKEVELSLLADRLKKRGRELKDKDKAFDIKFQEVKKIKNKYEFLYEDQLNINEKVDFLQEQIKELEVENSKIEPLQDKADNLASVLTNQMKAINLLVHDKEDYAIGLNKRQINLINALDSYTQSWLEQVGEKDLATEVNEKIGISKGVQENIDHFKKIERSQNRGPSLGGR
ncbi:plasmid recombination protein [Senegalia sp. (in: firmicutes)]|uniref:plasmid recombination protein n=1 Tax=Senegalia sp. (in: firmicutes) TaxID=1924098 RepID=UPI003F945F67